MRYQAAPPLTAAFLSMLLAACEDEGGTGAGGVGAGDTGTSQSNATTASPASTSASSGTHLPPPCDADSSPFIQPGCRDALRAECLENTTEDACLAMPISRFQGYNVLCSWSKVVQFSDPATCTVAAVSHRCEAALRQDYILYEDPCDVSYTDAFVYWSAVESEQELVKGTYGGPIAPETPGHYGPCGAFEPPGPEPICSCTEVACDAE